MKLKGVLDFSLGNFLCMRGFAPMGDLYDMSEPDPGFQRDLLKYHEKEMVAFLRDAEFLFFPEVILSTTLSPEETDNESVSLLYENVRSGKPFANLKFPDYRIACKVQKTKSEIESRQYDNFLSGTLELNTKLSHKFSRIDGNHRLSASTKDKKFCTYNVPFCLLLFRNQDEAAKFSRALFHNINYKVVPLTMEQNLKLILDDETLFPDEKLKEYEFFGWSYYLARKIYSKLDFEFLPNIKSFLQCDPRTFLVSQFKFLIACRLLNNNENATSRFKKALVKVNSLFDAYVSLKDSINQGLLSALIYYELKNAASIPSFIKWIIKNHLHYIEKLNAEDLIAIFDKVIESRRRTVFVSMPFGKPKADDHFAIICRVCEEINDEYKLNTAIKVNRVDWFHDGTSYIITDKIIEMMSDCGLLIGNLTYCNPNVYHEIGFVMGKAKAEGKAVAEMLLFLDESVLEEKEKYVGFNLAGIKQIRFSQPEKEFSPILKKNIRLYFNI
jgi:hypothetical protein